MLLFLDQKADMHADWVEAECDRRGVAYFRFCTETFPLESRLSVEIADGEVGGWIRSAASAVPIAEITGVWYRRPGDMTFDPALDEAYARFAAMEAEETLAGFYRVLWDRRWISPRTILPRPNIRSISYALRACSVFRLCPLLSPTIRRRPWISLTRVGER